MVNNASGVKAEVIQARHDAKLGFVKLDAISDSTLLSNTPTIITGQVNERPVYKSLANQRHYETYIRRYVGCTACSSSFSYDVMISVECVS